MQLNNNKVNNNTYDDDNNNETADQENIEPDRNFEQITGTLTSNVYTIRPPDMPREPYIRVKYDFQDESAVYRTTETRTVNDILDILPSLEQPKLYPVPVDHRIYDQWARVGKPESGPNKGFLRPISVSAKCCSIANAMSSASKLSGISESSVPVPSSAPARLASERGSGDGGDDDVGGAAVVPDRSCHSIDDIIQHYNHLFPTMEPGTISSGHPMKSLHQQNSSLDLNQVSCEVGLQPTPSPDKWSEPPIIDDSSSSGRCRTSPGTTRHQRMASTISAVLSATRTSAQRAKQEQVTVPTRMASIDLPTSANQSHLYYRTSQFWSSRHKKKSSTGVPRIGIFPQNREGKPEVLPSTFEELEAKLYSCGKGKLIFKTLGLAKQSRSLSSGRSMDERSRSESVEGLNPQSRVDAEGNVCRSAPDSTRRSNSLELRMEKAFKRRRHFSWFPQGSAAILGPEPTLILANDADLEEGEGRITWPSLPQRHKSRPSCMDRNERHVLCLSSSSSREDKYNKNSPTSPTTGFSRVQFMDLNELQAVFNHVSTPPPCTAGVQCTDKAMTSSDSRNNEQGTRA